jgi:predicted transcriptional regulator
MLDKDIIIRIKQRMIEMDMKQALLAYQLDWDQTKISRLFTAQYNPKLTEIEAIAKVLNLSLQYLLFGE